ncbi:disease resistance-like protein CSA1 [Cornus florida]|uniref:disease resistance-like protein CSA1 n=1 Tax=Cornus florida TaxID=4283 RepID=UPI00289F3008|nr:disease resistance-like protein CSA1 [Cornus florida]
MICLELVRFTGTAIKELPPSVGHLEGLDNLRILWLSDSVIKKLPSSIAQLSILELRWCYCNLDEESIVNLPHSLWILDLRGNDFVSLRSSFSQLTDLYQLVLADYARLHTLESLPSSIGCLDLRGCSSLQTLTVPEFTTQVLAQGCASLEGYSIGCNFNLTECHTIVENHGNGNGNKKPNIYYSQGEDFMAERRYVGVSFFPGCEIPSWFSHIKYESNGVDMTGVCLRICTNSLRFLKGALLSESIKIKNPSMTVMRIRI